MTMRRIVRTRKLTSEEAAAYRKIRRQVAAELPELASRHRRRTVSAEQLSKLLGQLKPARSAAIGAA
jgi:hypothetical protein